MKGLKATSSFQGCWTQWQRFESSNTHHFWDTPQHFLKTHFCLESGFLLFLELQKSILLSRVIKNRCLEYCYTKLCRWTLLWLMTPQYQSRDDLHTTTQNLADEPTFPEHNGKGLKALTFTISEIPHGIFSKQFFCLESGFLLFLELQKSLLVTFQGCWTQWERFDSSHIHHFWDTPQHFLKTHFCLESGFLLFLELQKSLLVTFQGCWTQWQRFESSHIHHFWDTPQHFLKTHFCLESGFILFLELQKSLLVTFQGCWTQWQRFDKL